MLEVCLFAGPNQTFEQILVNRWLYYVLCNPWVLESLFCGESLLPIWVYETYNKANCIFVACIVRELEVTRPYESEELLF